MEEQKRDLAEEYRELGQTFYLSGWVQGELKDLRQEVRGVRQELAAVEAALRQEISDVRQAVTAVEAALRQEINSLRQDVRALETNLRQEIKQELGGVRTLIWTTTALVLAALGLVTAVVVR